jgi:hypothetical protein
MPNLEIPTPECLPSLVAAAELALKKPSLKAALSLIKS